MYHINPFVKEYTKDGIVALFNSLTLDTVYLDCEEYSNYLKNPSSILIEKSFFVPASFDSIRYFQHNTPDLQQPSINVAYFLLTSTCNFRCKYCFVETRFNSTPESKMLLSTAQKGVELIKQNINSEPVSIVFYGGEPLLKFDLIQHIVHYAEELQLDANYVIITNGSIMNEEIAMFFKKYNFEVGISLDGDKDTNDQMRLNSEGAGTFDRISNSIDILIKYGIQPGISCTLSRHNMGNPLEIKNILTKHNLSTVSFNLPAPNANVAISKDEKQILVKNLMEAETVLLKAGILEDKVVDRRLRAFIEHNIWLRDCAAYGQQIVIMPNGKVGVCHGLWPDKENDHTKSYFDIDVNYKGRLSDHPIWQEWSSHTTFNMPSCWNCPAISLCGSGCAKNSLIKHGSIWATDEDICILMQEVVPWIIWTYYDLCNNQSTQDK